MKTGLGLYAYQKQIKGYPFEVMISHGKLEGAILCDQMRSLDWKVRKAKFIAHIPKPIFDDALAKFLILLPQSEE